MNNNIDVNHHRLFRRRDVLKTIVGATATGGLASSWLAAAEPAGGSKPTLHVYPDYGWLRGFSMIPSWGEYMIDAWLSYDGAEMRKEAALGKQVHANCIRLWIEYTAWRADPDKVTANFMDAVAAIGESDIKVMPCLFNRWHNSTFDYGGTYPKDLKPGWRDWVDYVKALVTPLVNDDRILVWDLCNEPQAYGLNTATNKLEYAWLRDVGDVVRACGVRQPITVGTMSGTNIDTFAPLMDVLCGHPYDRERGKLVTKIASLKKIQQRHGKPMLVNETIPGALDDAVRAEVARYYTELLSEAEFGWMGWALREGQAISTRRDRCDGNGIGGVGYHPYFTKSGKLRGGLDFLTVPPKRLPPWKKG